MKRFAVCAVFVLWVVSYAEAGTWTTLDYPGASSTEIVGVSGGILVGLYVQHNRENSFIYSNGNWTNLDYPGGNYYTAAASISDSNVVGNYFGNDAVGHGFLYKIDSGVWTTLDYPGVEDTVPFGISGDNIVGQIWGDRNYNDGPSFLYNCKTQTWTNLKVPGTAFVRVYGICDNTIVGMYEGGSFIYDLANHVLTCVADPVGAVHGCFFYGIEGDNVIGWTVDSSYNDHGFIYNSKSNTWTTLAYPGSIETAPLAINGYCIGGEYVDSGGEQHGFIYNVLEPVKVTVAIEPKVLNLNSEGRWITCLISLPADINVVDVNLNSIVLNGEAKADRTFVDGHGRVILVKLSRSAVQGILQPGKDEVTVSGTLTNGRRFEGSDTITVINNNGSK